MSRSTTCHDHDRHSARRGHAERRPRRRHLLVHPRRRQRRHQRRRLGHQRRHGGSDLDPGCATHRDRSGDLPAGLTITALNANDNNTGTAERRSGDQLRLPTGHFADHHGGRPLHRHQRPDRRRTHQLQRRHLRRLSARRRRLPHQPAPIRPTATAAASICRDASNANNFVVGEQGVNDVITGGGATT